VQRGLEGQWTQYLSSKEHKVLVGLDGHLGLRDEKLPVVVEDSIQGLEHVARGQIQLVQDDPVTLAHGLDEDTLLEDELARLVGHVATHVLLQIRVLVVVDPHADVSRGLGQVRYQARFPDGGITLQQERHLADRDDSHDVLQVASHRLREDVVLGDLDSPGSLYHPVALELHVLFARRAPASLRKSRLLRSSELTLSLSLSLSLSHLKQFNFIRRQAPVLFKLNLIVGSSQALPRDNKE
jgi:hypothetical protein